MASPTSAAVLSLTRTAMTLDLEFEASPMVMSASGLPRTLRRLPKTIAASGWMALRSEPTSAFRCVASPPISSGSTSTRGVVEVNAGTTNDAVGASEGAAETAPSVSAAEAAGVASMGASVDGGGLEAAAPLRAEIVATRTRTAPMRQSARMGSVMSSGASTGGGPGSGGLLVKSGLPRRKTQSDRRRAGAGQERTRRPYSRQMARPRRPPRAAYFEIEAFKWRPRPTTSVGLPGTTRKG